MSAVASVIVATSLLSAGAASKTKTVEIPARRFEPQRITIFVGDTVRWINQDNQRHTVTANSSAVALGESFDSSPNNCPGNILYRDCLDPGESFPHTFTTAGTFTYRCKLHGSDTSFANCAMCGQVIVKVKSGPPPSQSPTTGPTVSTSPSTSASPTISPSLTPTGTATSPGPNAAGPSEGGSVPVVAIAAVAIVILGSSGFLVYRTLLRR